MTLKITAIALSAVLALGLAATGQSASAQSYDDGVKVSYTDLNISTASGAKTLLRRIHTAAEAYCGDGQGHVPLDQRSAYEACVADAVDRTVVSLHAPVVSAMNRGQDGSHPTDLASTR